MNETCWCTNTYELQGIGVWHRQMWFCTMACLGEYIRSNDRCPRGVMVWTGTEMVPCQGLDGVVQCPECEHRANTGETHKCNSCEGTDTRWTFDPFLADIYDEMIWDWWCENCHNNRNDDI